MAHATWEGGDNSFLLTLFEQFPSKEKFHSEVLSELFFRTLNNPERDNFRFQVGGMRQACRVPYLNGGLFDNDEPAAAVLDFPKEYFAQLLEFFAQYNFTIDENRPDDHEVGIDPEMLGHIFENLLEENREKGAFCTPREIVQYMCQESLVEYLTKHLSLQGITRADVELLVREQKVTDGVHTYAELTDELLRDVTICDPAIGSGAFPMGMLQEIFTARRYIYPHLNTSAAFDPVAVKKHIIQHTIHGVDLDKGAVDIARLRFWLALVVDEDHPQPLPNLDYKIMQGNSLLESFEGIALDHLQPGGRKKVLTDGHQIGLFQPLEDLQQQQQVALEHLLRDYFAIGDAPRKRQLRKQIEILVHEHLHCNVEIQLNQAQAILAEAETIPARTRLDVHDSLAQRVRKEKAHEKQQRVVEKCALAVTRLEGTKQRLDALQDSAERPYFLWHLYFHDVFERGGFDVVIGNPPYIRQESIGKIKDELKLAYPRTYKGTADTLVYFVELGYNLLREDGVFAYIISNKWMRAGYGTGMRTLLKSTRLHQVLDFGDLPVFEDAEAYPCIVLFQKGEPNESVTALSFEYVPFKSPHYEPLAKHIAEQSYQLPIAQLDNEGWTLGDFQAQQLLLKLRNAGLPLKEYIGGEAYYGMKPGSARFFIDEATRQMLIAEDARSGEIIKPMLRGRDVARYATPSHDRYLLFTRRGIDISNYPAVERYLSQFQEELMPRPEDWDLAIEWGGRKIGNYKWYELQDAVDYYEEFSKPKITYQKFQISPCFVYDENGLYCNDSMWILPDANKYLLGVLNSRLGWYMVTQFCTRIKNGYQLIFDYLRKVPVAVPSATEQQTIETLVEKVLLGKRNSVDTSEAEAEIDARVMTLYGLTNTEATHVLNALPVEEQERNRIVAHLATLTPVTS